MFPENNAVYVISIALVCGLWSWSNAEVFSALVDCEPLLNTYKLIIEDLEGYVQKEEERLLALRKNLYRYKKEHEKAMEDTSNYLENPINAFTLIKRLTTDLTEIEQKANMTTEFIRNVVRNKPDAIFPDTEDMFGAATALTRLQKTYKLQVVELAEGKINGVPYSLPMPAGDCFELGRILYTKAEYQNAIEWMLKALEKYNDKEETEAYSFTLADIMNFISWSYYSLGDAQNASVWIKKLLVIDPNHRHAQANIKLFEKKITENGVEEQTQKQRKVIKEHHVDFYEALCRGEYEPSPEIIKRLTCFYLTKNHPFLRIAPIKAEQLYIEPDVFVFYDVMSDREIEHIKAVAKPKFHRAKVFDDIGELKPTQFRISKIAFIKDDDVISPITQRISDFTGLSMEFAEPLQVGNYGLGGHYKPHYDQSRKFQKNAFHTSEAGNRIATVLFYMSDVAQGGATVFTVLGLSVFPVKNAALFWMNLHPSGQGDFATLHAGCPVLRGSKWVSNKWIRANDQVFHRPCSLEYQDEGILRKYPAPVRKSLT